MAKADETPAPGKPAETFDHLAQWRDDWVGKIAKDPAKVPGLVVVSGYVSNAPDADALRLYTGPDLSHCIDIPLEEVVHREAIPKVISPLGGSYLWVNSSGWGRCRVFVRRH